MTLGSFLLFRQNHKRASIAISSTFEKEVARDMILALQWGPVVGVHGVKEYETVALLVLLFKLHQRAHTRIFAGARETIGLGSCESWETASHQLQRSASMR